MQIWQKVDHHAGSTWIHGAQPHKTNQSQSLKYHMILVTLLAKWGEIFTSMKSNGYLMQTANLQQIIFRWNTDNN